ncbi:unnamed protein product [Miscanthus lutarioriparius]|uniref:Uncharacterized protein n=1 Tax=Miscanthus lutarioriparius TaxID=422564 RepID=A0A811QZM0_9POAL|nr:unnamed protein product [Miscanthus lutarioriparius]
MADRRQGIAARRLGLAYLACYYISGSYWTQEYGYCTNTKHITDLAYAVSFLPYYWRAMQATSSFLLQSAES